MDVKDSRGFKPIDYAFRRRAEQGMPIVNALVKHGVKLHEVDISELSYAVLQSRADIFNLLVDSGIDVRAIDRSRYTGMTPLLTTISSGNAAMVDKIIKAGADVNQVSPPRETALSYALVCSAKPEIIRLLLDAGARIDLKPEEGEDALFSLPRLDATSKGANEIVDMILAKRPNVNFLYENGWPLLYTAITMAETDYLVRRLIDYGADPLAVGPEPAGRKTNALDWAERMQRRGRAQAAIKALLIQSGVKPIQR